MARGSTLTFQLLELVFRRGGRTDGDIWGYIRTYIENSGCRIASLGFLGMIQVGGFWVQG